MPLTKDELDELEALARAELERSDGPDVSVLIRPMPHASWTIAVMRHVPETRWWARLLGRRTRVILCHRFAPESLSLSMELNQTSSLSVEPPRAYRDVFGTAA